MLKKIIDFYRALPPAERPVSLTDEEAVKLTKKLRLQSFFAGTLGYSLYYVCRTGLNVVKTPIVESGMLNDQQLGIVVRLSFLRMLLENLSIVLWPTTLILSDLWQPD